MSKIFKIVFYSIYFFTYSHVMANEEAKYDIVKSNDTYEIRKYSDRLAVQVASISGNNGFRKLFNYISGNNEKNQKIKMTVPVTVMEKSGNMTMQFYLPSKFDKNNIPNPTGSDVEVINVEGGYYAVISYSGRASENNFIKHKNILEDELFKDNISIKSPAIKATYNSPFTLPLMRRNEAMFKVEYKD
ncbi:heme-binding protein [Candidatus Pelagibacter sp.]|nr:heme-binding protein [Candidatus Pelagibacter sp.]